MASINTRSNLVMKGGAAVLFNPVSTFPSTPVEGQTCFKEQVLYVYATLDNVSTWYPLTNQKYYYIFTQANPTSLWSINHNLGTKNIVVAAYDSAGEYQGTQPTFVDDDNVNLSFTTAVSGYAVIFGATTEYAGVGGSSGGGSSYILPIAANNVLGGVRIGNNLTIDANTGILSAINQLDGTQLITGDLIPSVDNTFDIGSPTKRLAAIYANDFHVGANTLYVNNKPVIQDVSSTITISTDAGQNLAIKTSGLGVINTSSDATITTQAGGSIINTVTSANANTNMVFQNQSNGGVISFSASGSSSQVQFAATNQISFTAPLVLFNAPIDFNNKAITNLGDVTITGNLTVNGTTTTINATTVTTKDNFIIVNNGELGTGVTAGIAGIGVDRGTLTDYQFIFDEVSDTFRVGLTSQTQAVATREDNPTATGIGFFNATSRAFETSSKLLWDGTNLKIDGTNVVTSIPVATASTVGGVKQGSGVSIAGDGTLTVPTYTLPTASSSVVGGIKVGTGFTLLGDGTLNNNYTLPVATALTLGGIKLGNNLTDRGDGTIDAAAAYTLPAATTTVLGGVKAGAGLSITEDGTLSATGGSGSGFTFVEKNTTYTASVNDHVACDTTTAGFTVTLPAAPSGGSKVIIQDAGGVFSTNNLTVNNNGSSIRGIVDVLVLDISWTRVEFVYSVAKATWLYSAY